MVNLFLLLIPTHMYTTGDKILSIITLAGSDDMERRRQIPRDCVALHRVSSSQRHGTANKQPVRMCNRWCRCVILVLAWPSCAARMRYAEAFTACLHGSFERLVRFFKATSAGHFPLLPPDHPIGMHPQRIPRGMACGSMKRTSSSLCKSGLPVTSVQTFLEVAWDSPLCPFHPACQPRLLTPRSCAGSSCK
jgi:hypothetical protein